MSSTQHCLKIMLLKTVLIVLCAIQAQAQSAVDPLCAAVACPRTKECRVVADNPYTDEATLRAECVDFDTGGLRDVCQTGHPILVSHCTYYEDLTCGPRSPCPNSTYCNSRLADTYAFCCRSDPTNLVKPGECPDRPAENSFCGNSCNNDGDCDFDDKCCRYGCRKRCVSPQDS